ncbi:hypothetical protein RchiOBHm_Chr1g0344111 [Rosa chinensis]|uniref:Uncharacterized protein n=1 Tax=Rosa chinensis TaxID=74649 RepID=A0A2P6SEF7_ROSCH|nr:hypothetical protein RchiOBHm_Chr1g0344111 [Rosa chinensis]
MCQSGEGNKTKLKIKVAEEMQAEKKGKIIAAILLLEALGFIPASVSLGSSLVSVLYLCTYCFSSVLF